MWPTLAVIPPFPQALLLPLCALVLAVSAGVGVLAARRAPQNASSQTEASSSLGTALFFGVALCLVLWVWSRNPIKLHSYGLMLIIGFLWATWLSCLEARRRGHDPNIILDLALPLLLVTVACCRLLYVALNHEQFNSPADIIRIWDGGLSFHGAIIGAVLVLWFYGWRSGIGFWTLGDIIAPSVFLGYFWGRVGCFLNGCCYGGPTHWPWAVVFPTEENRHVLTDPSHPAQLYSAIAALFLFWWMQRAKMQPQWNRFAGQLTLLFLALYAVERFFMEIFRNGATAKTVFGLDWLTQAQLTSILGLLAIAGLWLYRARQSTLSAPPSSIANPQS